MNRRDLLRFFGSGAVGLGLTSVAAAKRGPARKKVLMFTKSSGFEHDMIKRSGGKLSPAEQIVTDLAQKRGIEVTATKDGSVFSQPTLAQYDAFFFYTTGDLTTAGEDKNPPMTPEGKQAFLDLIHRGKGFIGTHSATDTFHGDHGVDPYIDMIGGEFVSHTVAQVNCIVVDTNHPATRHLGKVFPVFDEIYLFKNFSPEKVHLLLKLDKEPGTGRAGDFPISWTKSYGAGRVFYTALGHEDAVWANPDFQLHLLGGIKWALGLEPAKNGGVK